MAFISNNSTQSQPTTTTPPIPTQSNNASGEETQKKKNLIILVEKDSNDKLNELFDLSNKVPLQVPFNMRKLPASFFKPPSSGSKSPSVSVSHSRENSADSAFGSGTTILGGVNVTSGNPTTLPNGLTIHHSRAHSSPASLGKLPGNLSALTANVANLAVATQAQSSGTGNNTNNTSNKTNPGASANATSNSTTNSNNSLSSNTSLPQNILNKTLQHIHSRGRSYDVPSLQHQLQFGELPSGWEQAKTHDGKIYYIK